MEKIIVFRDNWPPPRCGWGLHPPQNTVDPMYVFEVYFKKLSRSQTSRYALHRSEPHARGLQFPPHYWNIKQNINTYTRFIRCFLKAEGRLTKQRIAFNFQCIAVS
jgi:hypothetical protein